MSRKHFCETLYVRRVASGHASVATTQVYVAVADDVLTTAATAWHAPRLRAV